MIAGSEPVGRIRQTYARWGRDTSLAVRREDWDRLFEPEASRAPAAHVPWMLAGVCRGAWIAAAGSHPGAALLYLHGGGFSIGSSRSHHRLIADLSRASGLPAFALDYRLAPEHRHPAALEDVLDAWHGLRATGLAADAIAIAGDSAGACLALSATLALRDAGEPLPAAIVLMSALTDLSASRDSYQTRADADPVNDARTIDGIVRTYIGKDRDPADPALSPLFADLTNLPPLLMQVGDREIVLGDTVDFVARARAAGCDAVGDIWPEMFHVFQQFPDDLDEARQAIGRAGAFFRTHVAPSDL